MEYIINATPKLKSIGFEDLNNSINNLHNSEISEIEMQTILDFIISNARMLINRLNIDVKEDPLTNKCDLMQAMVGQALEKLGINVTKIETQKTISDEVEGHSFLIANFPKKSYIVDPTYRQFFLKDNCTESKYFIKDNMILIAPHPGYYYVKNPKDVKIATSIIEDGYIELTEKTAKVYGDSFYTTHRGYSNNFNKTYTTNVSGNVYVNSFLKCNSNYSMTPEDLYKSGLEIDLPEDRHFGIK